MRTMRTLLSIVVVLPVVGLLAGCRSDEPLEHPEPLSSSPFEYPTTLWDRNIEGEAVLMVHITTVGEVDSAYVHRSSGYEAFDSAALAGAHDLRFIPGRKGDERVRMWVEVPVRFTRDASGRPDTRIGEP